MTSWIEPPPPQKGMGCFAKGCLIVAAFLIFLAAAFFTGSYFAVRYLRGQYFPRTGIELPAQQSSVEEQERVRTAWNSFERHARAHEPARIELTGDEINALIASEPQLHGRAYVTIEQNVARAQFSIPLDQVRWLKGHYLNAECTVQSSVTGDPHDIRFTSIVVNGRPVVEEAMRWQYGPWSLRRYLSDWTTENNLKTFEIRDGKVIFETAGGDVTGQ